MADPVGADDQHQLQQQQLQQQAQAARFDSVEQSLENLLENTRQLCMVASDFQATSQPVLNQKLQSIVVNLQELDAKKTKLQDVKVPIELLDYIDSGKNPQLYTKDCIERTLLRNKELNGKIEHYKKFRTLLLSQLGEDFPKETIQYRSIRDPTRQ